MDGSPSEIAEKGQTTGALDPPPTCALPATAWRNGALRTGKRTVPEETPIALTYDGSTYAVMMATPADIEDFAIGFSLTEGIVDATSDVESVEIVNLDPGIEARMRLKPNRGAGLADRRRRLAGPVGCGLCGIESLSEAVKPPRSVTDPTRFNAETILAAMARLSRLQKLNRETRAVHAAAFCQADGTVQMLREDVGRHNALDKLAGALARDHIAGNGAVLLTSRVSVEMVQKTAAIGCGTLVAVSAPTALALRTARDCGITLAAIARDDGFELFTHADRIDLPRGRAIPASGV